MAKGFLVQSVGIEGFKGFTTRKEINFNGRHVFLLGRNGNGKSSIIEAVRWGLFGSARRPNEVVANSGYNGRCRVDITLISEGKTWYLRRTLNRGTTGGSDPVLTDEHSQEHSIREIMPQLDSVDAGEGMHIIFAPQSTPLRRQPEDLSAFERTVFNHLGLAHPRALLGHIDNLLIGQELTEGNLGENLTDARDDIDIEIERLERQRGNIVSSPPWDSERPPSVAQSENKVRGLITEITGKSPDESLSGLSLDAIIDSAENALDKRCSQDQDGLGNEVIEVEKRKARLEELLGILTDIEYQDTEIQSARADLDAVLQGISIDELRNNFNEAKAKADAIALRRQAINAAAILLDREPAEHATCPVCETSHPRQDFEDIVHDAADRLSGNGPSDLHQMETHLNEAETLDENFRQLSNDLISLRNAACRARERIDAEGDMDGLSEQLSRVTLAAAISHYSDHVNSIREQINSQENWFAARRAQLSKMREEARFHQLQRDLERQRQSRNRFGRIETAYNSLVSFGESVREIQQAVSVSLDERLAEDLPQVSERFSQVFTSLTNHPWYDRLTIARNPSTKLELRVSSSQDPSNPKSTEGERADRLREVGTGWRQSAGR